MFIIAFGRLLDDSKWQLYKLCFVEQYFELTGREESLKIWNTLLGLEAIWRFWCISCNLVHGGELFKTGRHYILLFYETSRHQPKSKDPNIEKLLQHVERTFRCFSSSKTFGKLEVPTSYQNHGKANPLDLQKMHKKVPALPNNKLLGESVLQDELTINSCMSSHIPCDHPVHWNIPGNWLKLPAKKSLTMSDF